MITPLPAATLLLLRDFHGELQVFMQQRSRHASFVGGAYVFPGGKIDAGDQLFPEAFLSLPLGAGHLTLPDDFSAQLSKAFVIAALRECYEEAGVLLAYENEKQLLSLDSQQRAAHFRILRDKLNQKHISFADLCIQENLRLALDQLVYVGRWITPESSAQRFDTLFFACAAPAFQEGDHDNFESVNSIWLNAEQALAKANKGEMHLIYPTRRTLEHLRNFNTVEQFLAHQRAGLSVLGRE